MSRYRRQERSSFEQIVLSLTIGVLWLVTFILLVVGLLTWTIGNLS